MELFKKQREVSKGVCAAKMFVRAHQHGQNLGRFVVRQYCLNSYGHTGGARRYSV